METPENTKLEWHKPIIVRIPVETTLLNCGSLGQTPDEMDGELQ